MHVLVCSGYDTVEATEFQALSFHLDHAATEIKYKVIAKSIRYLHTPLKRISFSWRKNDIHLLVGKMILQKLLIFKAVSSTSDHTHIQSFDQNLHCHYRMWITSIKNQHRLYPIFIDQPTQLKEQQRIDIETNEELRNVVYLVQFVVEER